MSPPSLTPIILVVAMVLLVPSEVPPAAGADPPCGPMVEVEDGLLAHWDFNETNGTVLHDVSGNGHHGTVHGGTWTQGVLGGGLSLDGVDDRIQVPEGLVRGKNLTFNVWIRTTDNCFGIVSGANTAQDNEYVVYVDAATNYHLGIYYHGSMRESRIDISDGAWHMATVVTYDNRTRFYLDGDFVESCDIGTNTDLSVEGLWLATDQDSVNGSFEQHQHLKGTLDEISFWDRTLNDTEINRTFLASIGEAPVWTRVPTVEAVEDVPVTINVSSYVSDPDTPLEGLVVYARSWYLLTSEGSEFTFLFPNGVLEANVTLIASDGFSAVPTIVSFVVTPVNDPPELDPIAIVEAVEDVPCTIDLRRSVRDVDNDTDDLVLIVDDPYVTVHGFNLTALFPEGVTEHQVAVSVSDGLAAVEGTVRYKVTPVDDPPWVDALGDLDVQEDREAVFDLGPFLHDVDTPVGQLSVTTSEPNCTMVGQEAHLMYHLGGLSTTVTFSVSDGTSQVVAGLRVHVEEMNDPPLVGDVTAVLFEEDEPLIVDLEPVLSDEDDGIDGLSIACGHPCLTDLDGFELTFLFTAWMEDHLVEFTVSDGAATTEGCFLAQVREVNDPPQITGVGGSTPPVTLEMREGTTMWLEVTATDEDSPVLDYTARSTWKGVECLYNGTIMLTAAIGDAGEHSVVVAVDDMNGGKSTAELTVVVGSVFDEPFITSTPTGEAHVGVEYSYRVEVAYPEIEVEYLIDEAPDGMTVSAHGLLSWTPALDELGTHEVVVKVTDGYDWELQAFNVTVTPIPGNLPPTIAGQPPGVAVVGETFEHVVSVEDPEGDEVAFELLEGPPGMTLGLRTGRLLWTPSEKGSHEVSVMAHDGRGGVAYQNFTLTSEEAPEEGGGGGGFTSWIAGTVVAVAVVVVLLVMLRRRR